MINSIFAVHLVCPMDSAYFGILLLFFTVSIFLRHSGGYSVGVPPLPIPNREVKPNGADGTAYFVGE